MPGALLRKAYNMRLVCLAVWLGLLVPVPAGQAQTQPAPVAAPSVHTNQSDLEEIAARSDLEIGNLKAVFAYLFASLPERVKVYPTENYYYFRFHHNGVPYAGNFRLDAADRDKGVIDFAYFPVLTGWRQDEIETYKQLGSSDGVTVEKAAALTYTVSFAGKSVVFELNDLSGVKPPPGLLNDDESYIGPIFDESGIQFFLVFNNRLKLFHYILNETTPVPDEIYESRIAPRLVIGRRTGFAYYKDDFRDRKILVGVYEENIVVNNYYDGPFDQLPDNFLRGSELKDAIAAAGLADADTIDRFGILPGGDERVLIKPYISYTYLDDLQMFADCANDKAIPRESYYECFVAISDSEDGISDDGNATQGEEGHGDNAGQAPQTQEPQSREPQTQEPQTQDKSIDRPIDKSGTGSGEQGLLRRPSPLPVQPVVHTNEQFIEEMRKPSSLDIDNIDTVFLMVLTQLSPEVRVYPTENYYYFSFYYDGMDYSGNIRLSVADRDAGKVHFTYYKTYNGWRRDEIDKYKVFDREDGVAVEKRDALTYRVAYRGIARVFALNDLAGEEPQPAIVAANESYIGPVFDESGLQFYLMYNTELKLFHYILNESNGVPDELYQSTLSPRIFIGRRSGFAFYKDKNRERKILIGVYAENSNVNNYLDGPFDQLPDNFIRGETLRSALVAAVPELKGEIDRYGFWNNDESRYLIGPYLYYYDVAELEMFDQCATGTEMSGKYYYSCFYVEDEPG